jgi:predicted enzyme related to lactoylglutathione lyase
VEVLSSRVLIRPRDLERSRRFYAEDLGLAIFREFGEGATRGTVFYTGGGFLEVAGRSDERATPAVQLWLQVRDAAAAHEMLSDRGVTILRAPKREPWGLIEMWVEDPDGLRIAIVEIPPDHPIRNG